MTTSNKHFQPLATLTAPPPAIMPAYTPTVETRATPEPVRGPVGRSGGPAVPAVPAVTIGGIFNNSLVRAGVVIGMGFGGLADGIVLHQILGWHHLVCFNPHCQPATVAEFTLENTQDGYFHLALWLVLLAGTILLFRAARPPAPLWRGRILAGAMLAGSGLFNFFEGLVNHQILGIHHVLPGHPHQLLFDMLYLANGVLFFVIGTCLIRSARSRAR